MFAATLALATTLVAAPASARDDSPAAEEVDPTDATDAARRSPTSTSSPPEPTRARRWLSASIRQDFAWVDGDRVCAPETQRTGDFSCFRANETQYLGTPRPEDAASARGLGVATTRLLVGYQHFLGTHWALGALAGVVLRGGGPRSVGRDAHAFFPFHFEGQVSWWPAGPPKRGGGIAGFALAAGGVAQIDSRFGVSVREDPRAPRPPSQLDNPPQQTLDAYKKSGTGFVALGGGVAASTSDTLVWRLGAVALASFPASGVGAGLEAGVVFDL